MFQKRKGEYQGVLKYLQNSLMILYKHKKANGERQFHLLSHLKFDEKMSFIINFGL